MINFWTRVIDHLDCDDIVAVVSVTSASGSVPRDAGARMIITRSGDISGTIGGGALEFAVLTEAAHAINQKRYGRLQRDWPLGPDLGQCCGGRVKTLTEIFGGQDRQGLVRRAENEPKEDRTKILLFGAGHVGRAVVLALAPLPFDIRWIDSRADAFPSLVVQTAVPVISRAPTHECETAEAGSFVLVMTHSHALDLEITEAALKRPDIAYVGLIGSETKRARFKKRLNALGISNDDLARLICPIGLSGISGKEPAVIAASVAADLLIRQEGLHKRSEQASFRSSAVGIAELVDSLA